MEPEYQGRQAGGPWPVYVPGQHRSDENANCFPRGCHTAGYRIRGDVWRYDDTGRRLRQADLQGERIPTAEDRLEEGRRRRDHCQRWRTRKNKT